MKRRAFITRSAEEQGSSGAVGAIPRASAPLLPRSVAPLLCALAALAAASRAGAQLIGPIPPPTPPTPEYVPPPPAPRVEVPETDPIAPSIVERDATGRLKPLPGPPADIAIAKYPFDADRRIKINRSTAARTLDLDRFVANNVEKVLAAKAMEAKVKEATEFGQLFAARDAVAALRFERLLDRLERDQAVTLGQKNRLEEALREYDAARKAQIDTDAGADPTRVAVLVLRQAYQDATREPFASLDRQLDDAADQFWETIESVKLGGDQLAEIERLRGRIAMLEFETPQQRAEYVRSGARTVILTKFTAEQQTATLMVRLRARTPLPEPSPPRPSPPPVPPGGGH